MHDHYPDPTTEAGARVVEAVGMLASLSEALVRARAEQHRRQAAREQIKAQQDITRRNQMEQREAENQRRHADRERETYAANHKVFSQANNPDWLNQADLLDLAGAWRASGTHAETDPQAREAMEKVEGRLRVMYPAPMKLYDQRRADGMEPDEAMRPAAAMMATMPYYADGRPHGDGRVPMPNHLESRRKKTAAGVAAEDFPLPLKDALADIAINPEKTAAAARRKQEPAVAATRTHR